jgi:LPS-assembly protein
MRITALAVAASLLACSGAANGEGAPLTATPQAATAGLQPSTRLQPPPRGEAERLLPIVLQADRVSSQLDQETVAEGHVVLSRGGLLINADRLSYDMPQDLASARGHVRIERDGAVYSGPALELRVQRFEGYFLEPAYEFTQLGAGGRADRVDFIDSARSRATNATYTSCPRDGPDEPDWVLRARNVELDFDANEGIAEGAVLRFLGIPILALPVLSFPLTDARKSGWLPPSINVDSRSGVELAVPYYWNIAPNRDATVTPRIITRRGLAVDGEFRYLEPAYQGAALLEWLPQDRLSGTSREALRWSHLGQLGGGVRFSADLARVSDDDWWKDFPSSERSFLPRLLPLRLALERPFQTPGGAGEAYLRTLRWQVLQAADSLIAAPYQRSAQLGARMGGGVGGWRYALETEYNSFTLPGNEATPGLRTTGDRAHLVGSVSRPWREPGWWVVPRLSVNAASYFNNASSIPLIADAAQGSRVIPTFSIDSGLELERETSFFGRQLLQTLEPRLLYANTPFREQRRFPNYDSAARDFNYVSIYAPNSFSGIDRVSDGHQLTAGLTTRLVDPATGADAFNLTLMQRYLFRPQQVTAQADGTPDGEPLIQRFSDLLLVGSTSVLPGWALDASVQYNPDIQRSVRTIASARWSPGPFRTIGTTYRFSRGLAEQVELGWQWPVYGSARNAAGGCGGTLYSVGRVSYSLKDSRVIDSVLGAEYDAGCWIGRLVAERLSTGRSEATTRLMLQLELVGLSRLGSNPLQVLKDNIPGYRLLRED